MNFPIYHKSGFRGSKESWIKNPDDVTDAYHVDYRGGPDLLVRRGGPLGPAVGKVDFHKFRSAIDIDFENGRAEMTKEGFFSKAVLIDLPASPATSPFSWKNTKSNGSKLLGGNLKLVDAKGTVLALYASHSGSNSRIGVLTVTVTGLEQSLMDQVMVSFMAIMEQRRRQKKQQSTVRTAAVVNASAAGAGGG